MIAAEGEHKSSRALKNAADILSESSSAIQLRYLQTLNNIAAEKNSTIVFPLPMELLTFFLGPSESLPAALTHHKKNVSNADNCLYSPDGEKVRPAGKKAKSKGRDLTDL